MCEASDFSTFSPVPVVIICLLVAAILVGVKWCLIMVLIYISLIFKYSSKSVKSILVRGQDVKLAEGQMWTPGRSLLAMVDNGS